MKGEAETFVNGSDSVYEHCIVGDDGDLVFLALALKSKKICVIRDGWNRANQILRLRDVSEKRFQRMEEESSGQALPFDLISIDTLGHEFCNYLLEDVSDEVLRTFEYERVINDIVLLSCLCGNDFLPNLPMFGKFITKNA